MTQQEMQQLGQVFYNALTQFHNNQQNGITSNVVTGSRSGGDMNISQFTGLTSSIDSLIHSIQKLHSEADDRRKDPLSQNPLLHDKNGRPDTSKIKKYAEALEKEAKAKLELAKEEEKYIFQEAEIQKTRYSAAKKNQAYQEEQMRHGAKLSEIEAQARKKYIASIKRVFKEEEKIRREGLAKYEVAENNRKQHVKNIASKITNKKGQYSAGVELWNKLILAPLTDKFGKSFGKYATDSKGTVVARGANAFFGGFDKIGKIASTGKFDASGMLGSASSKLMSTGNPYAMAGGAVVSILKTAFEMYSKVDKAASDYARKVGGGAVAQEKMRKSAANLAYEMGKMGERTYNAEKILENMAATSEVFGRNLEYLSTQDLKAIVDLKDFGISNETISQFDTLGISIERISKEFAELYGSAGKKGLNATAVIKSLSTNMKMAQNYTFERGRKALFDMAEKSAQLKFNLRDAETFANKVSTLEGAMKSAAQLSVLGGGFAMQGNPMTLLYNALNNVEGLQDQMLAMTKDLVYWDRQKGQLEMSAFDRQRLRAMSEATGIDYSELTTQAFNQERINRISRQLPAGKFGTQEAEYIKNIAFLDEQGNARIQFHNGKGEDEGPAKLLKDLTEDEIKRLKGESEAKDIKDNATVGDIMNSTRSIQDKLDDLVNQVKNYLVKGVMALVDAVAGKHMVANAYGFSGEDRKQFERIRSVLTNNSTSDIKSEISKMSQGDRDVLRKMGIIDASGKYQGRVHDSWWQGDTYSNSEIGAMYSGAIGDKKEPKKFAQGGYTGDGNPTEIAGLVHKGEYVIDADTTKSMFSDIKNGENPLKFKEFTQRVVDGVKTRANDLIDGKQSVKVEFGTLHLELGGVTKDIDMNAFASLLLSNHSFIETLMQKMATTRDFGYRKDDAQFTHISHPYTT